MGSQKKWNMQHLASHDVQCWECFTSTDCLSSLQISLCVKTEKEDEIRQVFIEQQNYRLIQNSTSPTEGSERNIWVPYCRHIANQTLNLSGCVIYYFKPCRPMERKRLPCFLIIYTFPPHCREIIRQRVCYIVEQKSEGLGKNCRWLKPTSLFQASHQAKQTRYQFHKWWKSRRGSHKCQQIINNILQRLRRTKLNPSAKEKRNWAQRKWTKLQNWRTWWKGHINSWRQRKDLCLWPCQ